MSPDDIAQILLGSIPPTLRNWTYEVGPATVLTELVFRPTSSVAFLNIGDILRCFQPLELQVSWSRDVGESDSPRLVIQGGVRGKLVQARFVLKDAAV